MDFHPINLIKAHPLTVAFWMIIGAILLMAIDDRTGGAVSSRIRSLPLIGSVV
jgi:hypothetical protein